MTIETSENHYSTLTFLQRPHFNSSKIEKSAYFIKAEFSGPLEFRRASVGEELNFGAVSEGAIFKQGLNFTDTEIGFYFSLRDTIITGPAKFVGIKVGSDFYLEKATIIAPANFNRVHIGHNLIAEKAKFKPPDPPDPKKNYVIFPDMKVGHVANFKNAIFKGQVNFNRVEVGLELKADNAKFKSHEKPVTAFGLKVGTIASFQDVVFSGPAQFIGADIGGQFNASGAKFQSNSAADFSSMKVGELAEFTDAEFRGPVLFSRSEVGGKLITKVEKEKKEGTIIKGAVFEGEVSFNDAHLTDIELQGTVKTPFYITNLNLKRLRVDRDFSLEYVTVVNLEAENLRVDGQASFKNVKITKKADLSYSNFGILDIEMNIKDWPPKQIELEKKDEDKPTKEAGLILDGMEYKGLLPLNKDDPESKWINWLKHSRFDVGNYKRLENYFANLGYEAEADDVYVAMKNLELAQMAWYDPRRWLVKIFWGWLTEYGRNPFRIFWLALIIITIGAIFRFDPKYLKIDVRRNWNLNYKLNFLDVSRKIRNEGGVFKNRKIIITFIKLCLLRFITSFDQFIPAIELGLAKNWQPPELSFRVWFFLYFQKISGWILVPIGLAAIYSQFR